MLLVVLVLVLVLEVWECVRVFVSGVVLVLLLMLTQILFGPMVVSSLVVEAWIQGVRVRNEAEKNSNNPGTHCGCPKYAAKIETCLTPTGCPHR